MTIFRRISTRPWEITPPERDVVKFFALNDICNPISKVSNTLPALRSIPHTDDEDFCIIKEILQTLTHTAGRAVLSKLIKEKRKEKMVRRKCKVCTCTILPLHNNTKAREGTSVAKQRQQLTLTEMSVQPTTERQDAIEDAPLTPRSLQQLTADINPPSSDVQSLGA